MSIRNKSLIIRLTEAEHQALKAKAGLQGMSAYLRGLAELDEPPLRDPATVAALKDAWESEALREQFGPSVTTATPRARCTVKGCTFTSFDYPSRCPKHGFSHVELTY